MKARHARHAPLFGRCGHDESIGPTLRRAGVRFLSACRRRRGRRSSRCCCWCGSSCEPTCEPGGPCWGQPADARPGPEQRARAFYGQHRRDARRPRLHREAPRQERSSNVCGACALRTEKGRPARHRDAPCPHPVSNREPFAPDSSFITTTPQLLQAWRAGSPCATPSCASPHIRCRCAPLAAALVAALPSPASPLAASRRQCRSLFSLLPAHFRRRRRTDRCDHHRRRRRRPRHCDPVSGHGARRARCHRRRLLCADRARL